MKKYHQIAFLLKNVKALVQLIRVGKSIRLKLVRLSKKKSDSKKGGKDQETIQSSTTPDPGYNIGK